MRATLRPICNDFFGDPAQREKALRWNYLTAARAEARTILAESEALIRPFPRWCVGALLAWFDGVDDGDETLLNCRTEIEERIQTMIDCLDVLDGDPDREAEPIEDSMDREEEEVAA